MLKRTRQYIGILAAVVANYIIGVVHVVVIWKYLLPRYKGAFNS